MKAFQLIEHGAPGKFALRDIPEPVPAQDGVVVSVKACGLNRLDLWTEQGALPVPIELPRTPGCEIAGVISAVGPRVQQWHVGDRVAVQSNLSCGECEYCTRGRESLCLKGSILGVQYDGGFAEKVAVPDEALIRLPEEVSFESSAALTLAGSTAMHMLTKRTTLEQGDWVLVMGASSGVGSAGIQIAKQLGAYVITTGSSEEKRNYGKQLGADYVIDSTRDDWPAEVRRITAKRGVDVVLEHIGGDVLAKCFECLARGGRIVTCGATSGREVPIKLWSFFVKEYSLIGSYGRNRADIEATLDWAAQDKLKAPIHRIYPLSEAGKAFSDLRNRVVFGKAVVRP